MKSIKTLGQNQAKTSYILENLKLTSPKKKICPNHTYLSVKSAIFNFTLLYIKSLNNEILLDWTLATQGQHYKQLQIQTTNCTQGFSDQQYKTLET